MQKYIKNEFVDIPLSIDNFYRQRFSIFLGKMLRTL